MSPKTLPTVMAVLSLGASVGYACVADWRRSVYWFAAAVIAVVVTW